MLRHKYFRRRYRAELVYYKVINSLGAIWSIYVKAQIKEWGGETSNSPVLIVGVPRSGSTILYQFLTSNLDVNYIDNLSDLFNKHLVFGQAFSRFFLKRKHKVFKSYHGDTMDYGWNAPSECAEFWYKYVPRKVQYVNEANIDETNQDDFKQDLSTLLNKYGEQFLFKNLYNSNRVFFMKKTFPNSKFIYVKRDPYFNVQSLVIARRKSGVKDTDWYSVVPKNHKEMEELPLFEKIVKQVFFLEQQIESDLNKFFPNSYLVVDYSDMERGFEKTQNKIAEFLGVKKLYNNGTFRIDDKIKLEENEVKIIKAEINKLNWSSRNRLH